MPLVPAEFDLSHAVVVRPPLQPSAQSGDGYRQAVADAALRRRADAASAPGRAARAPPAAPRRSRRAGSARAGLVAATPGLPRRTARAPRAPAGSRASAIDRLGGQTVRSQQIHRQQAAARVPPAPARCAAARHAIGGAKRPHGLGLRRAEHARRGDGQAAGAGRAHRPAIRPAWRSRGPPRSRARRSAAAGRRAAARRRRSRRQRRGDLVVPRGAFHHLAPPLQADQCQCRLDATSRARASS